MDYSNFSNLYNANQNMNAYKRHAKGENLNDKDFAAADANGDNLVNSKDYSPLNKAVNKAKDDLLTFKKGGDYSIDDILKMNNIDLDGDGEVDDNEKEFLAAQQKDFKEALISRAKTNTNLTMQDFANFEDYYKNAADEVKEQNVEFFQKYEKTMITKLSAKAAKDVADVNGDNKKEISDYNAMKDIFTAAGEGTGKNDMAKFKDKMLGKVQDGVVKDLNSNKELSFKDFKEFEEYYKGLSADEKAANANMLEAYEKTLMSKLSSKAAKDVADVNGDGKKEISDYSAMKEVFTAAGEGTGKNDIAKFSEKMLGKVQDSVVKDLSGNKDLSLKDFKEFEEYYKGLSADEKAANANMLEAYEKTLMSKLSAKTAKDVADVNGDNKKEISDYNAMKEIFTAAGEGTGKNDMAKFKEKMLGKVQDGVVKDLSSNKDLSLKDFKEFEEYYKGLSADEKAANASLLEAYEKTLMSKLNSKDAKKIADVNNDGKVSAEDYTELDNILKMAGDGTSKNDINTFRYKMETKVQSQVKSASSSEAKTAEKATTAAEKAVTAAEKELKTAQKALEPLEKRQKEIADSLSREPNNTYFLQQRDQNDADIRAAEAKIQAKQTALDNKKAELATAQQAEQSAKDESKKQADAYKDIKDTKKAQDKYNTGKNKAEKAYNKADTKYQAADTTLTTAQANEASALEARNRAEEEYNAAALAYDAKYAEWKAMYDAKEPKAQRLPVYNEAQDLKKDMKEKKKALDKANAAYDKAFIALTNAEKDYEKKFDNYYDAKDNYEPYKPKSADFDGNGTIDDADTALLEQHWRTKQGDENYDAKFDLDGDGYIGLSDYTILSKNFGQTVEDQNS